MSVWMRPVIQMTNLMRSIGFALSPQISKPFLGQDVHDNLTNVTTASTSTGDQEFPRVQFAYWIMSALDIILAVVCMSLCAWSSVRNKREIRAAGDDKNGLISEDSGTLLNTEDTPKPSSGRSFFISVDRTVVLRYILLSVIFLLLVMYGGITMLFFLLYTYLYEYLGWSVYSSTLLITMSYIMRLVFGVMVALISRFLSPARLSIINLVNFVTSSVLMLLGSLGWGDAFTVIAMILIALTGCNMHPTTITLADETIHVTAPVMALLVSTMEWAFVTQGPVAGALLHKAGAIALPIILLTCALSAVILFLVYSILARLKFRVYEKALLDEP